MSKPKYANFINQLVDVVNSVDTKEVKLSIGDSINNNRSLTVGQVIRFLLGSNSRNDIALGLSLQSVYNILKGDIYDARLNYRTDAIDINEFINFYETTVVGLGDYRAVIGRNIELVA